MHDAAARRASTRNGGAVVALASRSHHFRTIFSTVRKVSLAIQKDALDWAERTARRQKRSVSAVLSDLALAARARDVELKRQAAAWKRHLDDATDGKGLSEEQMALGRRELDGEA